MLGIDLLFFLINDKFVKYVADFIWNAWYKLQNALFIWIHCVVFVYIIIIIIVKLRLYCTFYIL